MVRRLWGHDAGEAGRMRLFDGSGGEAAVVAAVGGACAA